jgi:hypothetical protein
VSSYWMSGFVNNILTEVTECQRIWAAHGSLQVG